jgi:hypothetical protein
LKQLAEIGLSDSIAGAVFQHFMLGKPRKKAIYDNFRYARPVFLVQRFHLVARGTFEFSN